MATHPSDMCVALAALDARVVVEGPDGRRVMHFDDLHRLPGNRPELDTTLEPNELITEIELGPSSRFAAHSCYLKVRERSSYAFALVSVAAALDLAAQHPGSAHCARWRRGQAVARPSGRGVLDRSSCHKRRVHKRGGSVVGRGAVDG